jgi:hypothetical protein
MDATTFQINDAGVDHKGNKLYTLFAESLPGFDAPYYDRLLAKLLEDLSHLKEESYSIVFFCSHSNNIPPWSWIIASYYKLDRSLLLLI